MITIQTNLFTCLDGRIVIPTNGCVRKDGMAVMGAGLAKQAADHYGPDLPRALGRRLLKWGNHVFADYESWEHDAVLPVPITFPTKADWRAASTLDLIQWSAAELLDAANRLGLRRVYMPWVGCGLGGLARADVKVVLDRILDDRFTIVEPLKAARGFIA